MSYKFSDSELIGIENTGDGGKVRLILSAGSDDCVYLNNEDIAMIAMYAGLVVYPKDSKVKCRGER
jgi:hypothetical protein